MTSNTSTPGRPDARPPEPPAERSPAEIEAEIERTRVRLAGTVDAIAERLKPANVARRGVEAAKAQVLDERGDLRTQRVAVIAVAVLAGLGLITWRRSR